MLPTAPPTQPQNAGEVELLLEFLRDRDHACPRCGYNLRNLTQPVCPECREDLALKVGAAKQRIWPLLLAITPGTFCFIVCCIFSIALLRFGPPRFQGWDWLLAAFFAASGTMAAGLAVLHQRYLRASDGTQLFWIVAIWSVHVLVLLYCLYQ